MEFDSHISLANPGRTIRSVYGRIRLLYGPVYVLLSGRSFTGRTIVTFSSYTAVFSWHTAPYTVSYYCVKYYAVIRCIYGRKLAVFSSFTVRKRPAKVLSVEIQCV